MRDEPVPVLYEPCAEDEDTLPNAQSGLWAFFSDILYEMLEDEPTAH